MSGSEECFRVGRRGRRTAAFATLAAAVFVTAQGGRCADSLPDPALSEIRTWFAAWELVSRDVYGIEALQPVEFVFFDAERIYTTSAKSGAGGRVVDGPGLLDSDPAWRVADHGGLLTLPDGNQVPVGLMSFAAPADGDGAFFVMPLPAFWETAGVTSEELGLGNLLTGVFLHEFSHSQQMHSFGAQLSAYEQSLDLDRDLDDDIVQDLFASDPEYAGLFRREMQTFFDAAHNDQAASKMELTREALALYDWRQQWFFVGERAYLGELDAFFLSMEGTGQYSMYAWLIHPQGGGLDPATAEAGTRRGGRWWSQEEGLAVFLVLADYRHPKDWGREMFGANPGNVVALVRAALAAVPE